MRRPILLALLFLLAATPLSAQQFRAAGIKLGGTVSTIQTNLPSEEPVSRRGLTGVLFAEWAASARTALVAEAGYVERGYAREFSSAPDGGGGTAEHRDDFPFRYVSVAALGKVEVLDAGPAAAYVLAGPRANVLLCCEAEDVPEYDYRRLAWDAAAGIGARASRGLPLLAEVRVSFGLSDALQGDWRGQAYHRAVDLLVGIEF